MPGDDFGESKEVLVGINTESGHVLTHPIKLDRSRRLRRTSESAVDRCHAVIYDGEAFVSQFQRVLMKRSSWNVQCRGGGDAAQEADQHARASCFRVHFL